MGWQWGPAVRLCLALGGPEFCKLCAWWSRVWFKTVLGKSPTFVGFTPRQKE